MKGHPAANDEVVGFNSAEAQANRQIWIAAFASAVCWLREQAHMTRQQLAGRLGVNLARVVSMEKGKRQILAADLIVIAYACNSHILVLVERACLEASPRGWEPERGGRSGHSAVP
jgi:transcriptional regulator with XRE-family HTH domain